MKNSKKMAQGFVVGRKLEGGVRLQIMTTEEVVDAIDWICMQRYGGISNRSHLLRELVLEEQERLLKRGSKGVVRRRNRRKDARR